MHTREKNRQESGGVDLDSLGPRSHPLSGSVGRFAAVAAEVLGGVTLPARFGETLGLDDLSPVLPAKRDFLSAILCVLCSCSVLCCFFCVFPSPILPVRVDCLNRGSRYPLSLCENFLIHFSETTASRFPD